MPYRVLIIEDDGALRFALRVMLESEPYVGQIETVPSGEAALRVAPGLDPDVVVADHGLPGLRGQDLADRLRDLCPGARLVSFSGRDGPAPWADNLIRKGSGLALEDLRAAVSRGALTPSNN